MDDFRGKRALVMGLGLFGGGAGAARFLAKRGARVTVTDLQPAAKLAASVAALADVEVAFRLGGHDETDFRAADLIVVNPAVPPGNPFLLAGARAGAAVVTEIGLFLERCRAPVIAVTGSAGKSTTASLTAHLLKDRPAGAARLGGNIGGSLLDEVDALRPDGLVVLELSSFQLHRLGEAAWTPAGVVVTNVTPNHLDWHGTFERYRDAKRSLVNRAGPESNLALNADDPETAFWAAAARGRARLFSTRREVAGAFLRGDRLWLEGPRAGDALREIGRRADVPLIGLFNVGNALAALLAARPFEPRDDVLLTNLRTFRPVPHRLEKVAVDGRGVTFINDSKATTPESAMGALGAVEGPVALIAGGYDKGSDFAALGQVIARRCRVVCLLGATQEKIAAAVAASPGPGPGPGPEVARFDGDFDAAVRHAAARAAPGGVALLSPACASWGMFRNYEERGERFRALAREISDT